MVLYNNDRPEQPDDIQQKLYKSLVGKVQFAAIQFGLKHAPQVFSTKMEEFGRKMAPDWVAPSEGIQDEPGDTTYSGDFESGGAPDGEYYTRSKSRKSGAGLPIPEGCLDNARVEWENGQSSRDPGDM